MLVCAIPMGSEGRFASIPAKGRWCSERLDRRRQIFT